MSVSRFCLMLAAICSTGFAIAGATLADEMAPPLTHSIPRRVFEITVDGFKQVSSANVNCGTLPGEIATIVAYPAVAASSGFSFDAGERSLTLRMTRNTGKKPVDAGSFSWSGATLNWTWKTFPSKDIGDGVKELREYFTSNSFVATLTDGRFVVLSPPPSELTCAVAMQPDGILLGTVDAATVPDGAIVSVEWVSGGAWITTSSEAGFAKGTVAGKAFLAQVRAGKCTVQQDSPRLLELRELTKQLEENKKLASSLPENQRRILESEDAKTAAKVAALKQQVEADRLPDLKAVLRVRATDAASGRVYAIVITTIGN